MKIIDLLNKIANGEETPKKFKYDNLIFTKRWDNGYFDNDGDDLLESLCLDFSNLNNEVEIIEENKKIEKLETYKEVEDKDYFANILKVSKNGECEIDEATSVIVDRINQIIEVINNE